jgi:dihydrofolate reductase
MRAKENTMSQIISTLFVSLDGTVEPDENWHFPYYDDAMGAAVNEDYNTADTLLLGRVTYDSFAGAWPDREAAGQEDAAFAKILGDMRKVVVSRQRLDLGWRNVERIDGDLISAAKALRDDPSVKGVLIPGSISVVRQLMSAGLIDELRLLVHPVAARSGMKLFDEGEPSHHFRLVKAEALPTGVMRMIYAPTAAPGAVQRQSQHTPDAA